MTERSPHATHLPRPHTWRPHPWLAGIALGLSLTAPSAFARVTCQLRNLALPTNPFTLTSNLQPFGTVVYTRTTLTVTCQRDDNRTSAAIEIGASNTMGSPSPRKAILTTNRYWSVGYALTRGGGCASNIAASNWFEYGTGDTFRGTVEFNGSSSGSLDVPVCITVGHDQNVSYRVGTYQDNITFTLAYQEWLVWPETTTSLDMVYQVNVSAGCRISQNPQNLHIRYTALSSQDITASTSLGLTCNPELPWSARLSASNGRANAIGLPYSLSLSTTWSYGTGTQQSLGISATIPKRQAGACVTTSCVEPTAASYTVTVDY